MKNASFAGRLALGLVVAALAAAAHADPLNPLEFPSLGSITLSIAGTYTLRTDTAQLTGPAGFTTLNGVFAQNEIAVFNFDSLTIPTNVTINIRGHRACALLSKGDMTINGMIIGNGATGGTTINGCGGLGGGYNINTAVSSGPGGGGGASANPGSPGGGTGASGGGATAGYGSGGFGGNGAGFNPGLAHGNLLRRLEAGSGGGGGTGTSASGNVGGGGGEGGAAIEIGALGQLDMTSSLVSVNGGNGGAGTTQGHGGDAGSGGGVLIHAGTIVALSGISAVGGNGGGGGTSNGGGGGRIAVQSTNLPATTFFNVSGGTGAAGNGANGIITNARAQLVPIDLDFGDVRVGQTKTLFMAIQNTGDADTSVNGLFPDTLAPFSRAGNALFTGLHPGEFKAAPYSFMPTAVGPYSQTALFISDGGSVSVHITGSGVSGCGSADFNGDGDVGTDADIAAFFRVLAGGSC
jgi:hypothetical protein